MEKLVLIDGNSLINRAFYAMPLMVTKGGLYTNAVYGFMNMFIKMANDINPDYVAVAFDVHAPTFRHNMFTDYKGTRKPMPEELRPQIPLLKEVLRLMNVKTIEQAGIEADDIIGTIAKSTQVDTIIITGDRDSLQLVDGETSVYFTKRGISDLEIYSIDNFKEKTGIEPKQIIDLKSLMGDSSDNIPGIKGIGEKTAVSLLQKYQSLDNLYLNVGDLTGKLKEKIENGKDSAYLSYALATIKTDCDIDLDIEKMRYKKVFSYELLKEFTRLEFRSIVNRTDLFEKQTESDILRDKDGQVDDKKQIIIEDKSQFNIDFKEDISFFVRYDKICLFSSGVEYVINIKTNLLDDGVSLTYGLEIVKDTLEKAEHLIVFDKKKLKHFLLENSNINLTNNCDDVAVIKYLADFSSGEESLEEVISEYGKDQEFLATSLYQIYLELKEKLKKEEMTELYNEVELPLIDVLFDMEIAGVRVDTGALYETGKKYAQIVFDLDNQIKQYAGDESLNVNSPKQLGEVLFEKLKIGKGKKTKNGYSTSAEILEELEDAHPIVPSILRYRQIQKLQSTYIEGFKPLIDKSTGLIHTSFNQLVTSTGRLSSKEPNLQNIPVRDDEGRELRKFFVSKFDGGYLISADYSQIELRLLACFSNCPILIEAFNNGEDVHTDTASKVFGVNRNEVTPKMRRDAKAVNFGIIYGISEYGLAKNIGTSAKQAKEYINSYFTKYPEVKAYMQKCVDDAKERGYAKTLFGRRRLIRELMSSNYALKSFGERVAMNMPLQGSAADIIKIAMLKVAKRLKENNLKSQLVLQVHDELIIDTVKEEKEIVEKLLKEEMENAVNLAVKLTVDVGSGKNWFEAK